MKFTDGYWMLRSGSVQNNAIEVYDYQIMDNRLIIYAPFKSILTKGDTFLFLTKDTLVIIEGQIADNFV